MYLYQTIETSKQFNAYADLPSYIPSNLNNNLPLRDYQKEAFQNFITYFENEQIVAKPCQTLFHMATGSGKTLIMAGLILYLYKKGYRNFLFFVNSTTIIKKTKDNFLSSGSSKYLFNKMINIDGKNIKINEVSNFQNVDKNDINICFYTVQGLHLDINFSRENKISIDDFVDTPVVLISDEAHHINVDTTSKKVNNEELELLKSWEHSVNMIFHTNVNNVMLEFTATCDLENPNIKSKYLDKIIFNYPLSKFREDGYSKEIETLQSDVNIKTRMIQAILISQYRLKLFQDNKIFIKPVILFKSDTITNSKVNMQCFVDTILNLSELELIKIKETTTNEILINAFSYFEEHSISLMNLIQELKEDFSKEKCLSVNDDDEADNYQLIVNSLEDKNNEYRAIFEVKKLDEGWDVLNLFDIVRLYETRDSKNGKPGNKTIQEAQLIGRGARYCPFILDGYDEKYKRKFDYDITNEMRICETLLYHCQFNSRYISELKTALKETGLIPENVLQVKYILKDGFKKTKFYTNGLVFFNKKELKSRNNVKSLPESIRQDLYEYSVFTGKTYTENLFQDLSEYRSIDVNMNKKEFSILDIYNYNKNLVLSSLRKFPIYKFNSLKSYFPNLESIEEFVTSDSYLGSVKIVLKYLDQYNNKNIKDALVYVFNKLISKITIMDEVYSGTKEFESVNFRDIFKDKVINISNPNIDSVGISQAQVLDDEYKLDLSNKDWYVYNDNYGTTEEKKFVKYFNDYIKEFEDKYDNVYLIRNERVLKIYSFEDGERFEPDYLLILENDNKIEDKQYQIFIEPKGTHLLQTDKWKENLLLSLKNNSIPVTKFVDNKDYFIWGLPFYNKENNLVKFDNAIKELL